MTTNGTNPMDLMLQSDVYDQLLRDAEVDNRVGDHDLLTQKVVHDKWPSGDPRTKITFVLLTANNAKADLTLSPPPPPEVVAAEKATWEPGKLKAIANSITLHRQLAQHYGVAVDSIKEGDRFKGKTVKTKRNDDGTGGFIRVVAFLPKDHPVGEQAAQAAAAEAPAF